MAQIRIGEFHPINRAGGADANMTEPITKTPWSDNKDLVIFWLLVFFPVGLWALWTGNCFEKNRKIQITIAVAAILLVGSLGINTFLYFFIAWPAALFLLWRNQGEKKTWFYVAVGVFVVLGLLNLGNGGSGNYSGGGSCAAVMTEGNCTYYRDDNCNVIARECS